MKVSISKVKSFKACRRAYYFKYIEGLEPTQKAEALQTGIDYHEYVEMLNTASDKMPLEVLKDEPNTKEKAMAMAYGNYILPQLKKVQSCEVWKELQLTDKHILVGRLDGIMEDGSILEHKTTSAEITPQYEYNLMWDEQILAYMLLTGSNKIMYTVCRKPTIRQKQNESDDEFYARMYDWYSVDTNSKIKLLEITRTDAEVQQFKQELIDICDEMENCKNLYKNCGWCNVWGRRCEYSSICLNYDPNEQYIDFVKKERE